MDSILNSVKKMLGISEEYTHFDADIIMHINSVFMVLNQIGVGPPDGFSIEDENDSWSDFIPEDNPVKMEAVKTYVYQKVKLIFDPPASSAAVESTNRSVGELEWRLNFAAELTESN